MAQLGFLLKEGKSQLVLTLQPGFLGSIIDLVRMLVFPSKRRICAVSRIAALLLSRHGLPFKFGWQGFTGHLTSLSSQTHSPHPAHVPGTVETVQGQSVCPDLRKSGGVTGVEMVGGPQEPLSGSSVPPTRSDYVHGDGCFQGGLGRPFGRLDGLMSMVSGGDQTSHKLVGAPSSVVDHQTFPISLGWCSCRCHIRQHDYGCVHQQGRWDAIPFLVSLGSAGLGLVQTAGNPLGGCPHSRIKECPGRRSLQRDASSR